MSSRFIFREFASLGLFVAAGALAACGSDDGDASTSATSAGQGGQGGQASANSVTSATSGGAGGELPVATSTSSGNLDEPVGGAERPVEVFVPSAYDAAKPMALVILLHGFTADGDKQELYLRIQPEAEKRGFLYAHPDGLKDANGNGFWNATDACCDFGKIAPDDSGYLRRVIDDVRARYDVDDKRIFFIGHSNGGFMSHRMACEHADRIAAIASFAGAQQDDASKCKPSEPVAVLQVHGSLDPIIDYGGGENQGVAYPGAATTVADWAALNGCGATPASLAPDYDMVPTVLGDETERVAHPNCAPGGAAELWTMKGAGHVPAIGDDFIPNILDFLFAHPKP